MPQYQKELNAYALHMSLAEECVKLFNGKMKQIVETEQNLAMGCDANGKIRNKMKNFFLQYFFSVFLKVTKLKIT